MIFNKHVLFTALATTLCLPAIAKEQAPIIVTATKTAQTADSSLASVTVITQKEIEQQQANDLRDLLTSVSGIDMYNNGGVGKKTQISIRGTSTSHVLVLVDGIRIGSATNGDIALQHIPINQIERIEIVRGPRASLYGSEAVGGVIQIFTKKGQGKEQANLELGYGSFESSRISAGFSGKTDNTTYSINASHLKTAGIDAKTGTETDNDGYENNSITFNASHKISNTSSLSLNMMDASGHTEYDGSPNNTDFEQQTTGLQYTFSPSDAWSVKLNTSTSQDNTNNYTDLTPKSRFNTRRNQYSWQNDINMSTSQFLTVGVDYQDDIVDSTTTYKETSRDNTAGYIQHQWSGDENDLLLALRNDDNQAFGTHTTGNIAWGHNFNDDLRIISSYGTAFKAPTFNDLYYPSAGNPNLKPENSESTEVELRSKHAWGKWSLSAYHTTIDNLIIWKPANVDKAEINGMELRLNTNFAGWDTKVELSLLDPRDKKTNKILRRRTQETLRIDMDKTTGQWSSGISFIAQGLRYDDVDNTKKVKGYSIINLRASYAVSKKLSVKWKIENLLNEEYQTALDYNNPGVSGYIAFVYQGF